MEDYMIQILILMETESLMHTSIQLWKLLKKEIERIGNAWKQYEIDAIGTAAKFENLAKQISSINNEEKTEIIIIYEGR